MLRPSGRLAAGALNSSQWPSWSKWEDLDPRVKADRLKCNKCGLAVAEKGNPMQTFRCKNVSSTPPSHTYLH